MTTAHERALCEAQVIFDKNRMAPTVICLERATKTYLKALLDDAETVEKIAAAIGGSGGAEIYAAVAAVRAIATLKHMGGV